MADHFPPKRCSKCGFEKSREVFSRQSTNRDGLKAWCKPCMVESAMESAVRNPERVQKHKDEWKKRNPETVRLQGLKDKRKAYERDPEKHRRLTHEYYVTNRKRIAAKRATPEGRRKRVIAQQRREARKRRQGGSGVTRAQWEQILKDYGHECAYCPSKGPLAMDHIVPISRGGSHDVSNVVPACKPCNSSKNDRLLLEWLGYDAGAPIRRP